MVCDGVSVRKGRLLHGVVVGVGDNVYLEVKMEAVVVVEQEREGCGICGGGEVVVTCMERGSGGGEK
ncbi:hypothetical protein Acr_03g0008840 [Actinidia rufa]|uniref:Uncharacterized protein n=1 Tax=Actinidia rufa TaxID=165716 RepID=A0A7J0ECJ4_9ERIC|nr:hypothetical protein Acr_03g0008840 [Actinidia rufa]